MENFLELIKPHASWLFGSGGLAAVVLTYLKFFRSARDGKDDKAQAGATTVENASAGQDIVTGNKVTNTKTGLGGLEVALIVAIVACLGGLGLMFAGDSFTATGGSAAVKGSGNTTNVTSTTPSE